MEHVEQAYDEGCNCAKFNKVNFPRFVNHASQVYGMISFNGTELNLTLYCDRNHILNFITQNFLKFNFRGMSSDLTRTLPDILWENKDE